MTYSFCIHSIGFTENQVKIPKKKFSLESQIPYCHFMKHVPVWNLGAGKYMNFVAKPAYDPACWKINLCVYDCLETYEFWPSVYRKWLIYLMRRPNGKTYNSEWLLVNNLEPHMGAIHGAWNTEYKIFSIPV